MNSFVKMAGGAFIPAAFLLAGCGNLTLGKNVNISVDSSDVAHMSLTLADGLEMPASGSFPVGQNSILVSFGPAVSGTGATISIQADLMSLLQNHVAGVTSLKSFPNGAPLPTSIQGPLTDVPVIKNSGYSVDAAFSLSPNLELAAFVDIPQFSTKYLPGGVSACQDFKNALNVYFAAICVYGPKAASAGSAAVNGGIFVGANFGPVVPSGATMQAASFDPAMPSVLSEGLQSLGLEKSMSMKHLRMNSSSWDPDIHDPMNQLQGATLQKTVNNVRKVLRARH